MPSWHILSPVKKAWLWMIYVSEEFADLGIAVISLVVFPHWWQALHLTLLGPSMLDAGAVHLTDCEPGDNSITTLCFNLMESSESQGQEVNWKLHDAQRSHLRLPKPFRWCWTAWSLFFFSHWAPFHLLNHSNNDNLYKYDKPSSLYQAFFPLGIQVIWAEARSN